MNKHLWQPTEKKVRESILENFVKFVNFKSNKEFKDFWKWSVTSPEIFWSKFWDYSKIVGDKGQEVIRKNKVFNKTKFFPDSKINYSENILKKKTNDIAINFLSETGLEENITWKLLYEKVCKFSFYLKSLDLKKGDRVAAYVPNKIESIVSFLACAKIGVIWSSCSPDFGVQGVVDRFKQIKPKVLITSDYYFYNGKKINILEKVNSILERIPAIK
jgi:acetoacetyl-CoA synthetase